MQKTLKKYLVFSIIAVSFIGSISVLTQVRSYTRTTMDYVYFYIYQIDIIDDFDGKGSGTITMKIDFDYKRMFGTYGERLINSNEQYDDIGIENYIDVCEFNNNLQTVMTVGKSFDPSYCYRIDNPGDEYKLTIRIKKGIRTAEYETIYLGEDEKYYNSYYWTELIYFNDYDGIMKLYYKVVY
ncbi:MAG TPA: hypothetical protein VMZ29_15250 [Candidatus Bathyarchaeia archaeon]|nr:hypothetical protein [Candidatus Bathyarchaeia archaeon]